MKKYAYILALTALLGFGSCVKESEIPAVPDDGKITIELFTRVSDYFQPTSRAGALDESYVDPEPWIVVFEGSGTSAVCREVAKSYRDATNKTYVELTPRATACELLVLTNTQSTFYYNGTPYNFDAAGLAVLVGKTLGTVCDNMTTERLSATQTTLPYEGKYLPMSLQHSVSALNSSLIIGQNSGAQLYMARAVAKMVVRSTASTSNFVLEGITMVQNVSREGRWHRPGATLWDNPNLVTYSKGGTADIAPAAAVSGVQSTAGNPLYIYETPASKNTTLIVKGKYGGSATSTYYKMAVVSTNLTRLDIERNKEYTFTITKVSGNGFGSIAEAQAGDELNAVLEYAVAVADNDSYDIISEEDFYMGFTNSVCIASTGINVAVPVFSVTTNCTTDFAAVSGTTSGIFIESGSDVTLSHTKVPVAANSASPVTTEVKLTYTGTSSNSTVKIRVKLGRMEKIITVYRVTAYTTPRTWSFYGGAENTFQGNYLLSGTVPSAYSWLSLRSPTYTERTGPGILVEDGKIDLLAAAGSGRAGYAYLTAVASNPNDVAGSQASYRIKVFINQP